MTELNKWQIYCSTENKNVMGYLPNTHGTPTTCFNNNTHTINQSFTTLLEKITDYTPHIIKWKVYCDTEQSNVFGYLPSSVYPDFCFNNVDHEVSKKATLMDKYQNNTIRIKEEPHGVNGYFSTRTINIDIAPLETKVQDYSWPYNMAPLAVTLLPTTENLNDSITIDVSPDKIIGVITATISIGTTTLNVSSTVIQYIQVGFLCSLFDGTNTNNLGYVLKKNFIDNTITVETATTNEFLATTPTYVRMSVRYLGPWNFYSISNGSMKLGESKIGASFIPANEIVRLTYINTTNETKKFSSYIEYLY